MFENAAFGAGGLTELSPRGRWPLGLLVTLNDFLMGISPNVVVRGSGVDSPKVLVKAIDELPGSNSGEFAWESYGELTMLNVGLTGQLTIVPTGQLAIALTSKFTNSSHQNSW